MNRITTLLKARHVAAASLVFGLASAGAQSSSGVDHPQGYEAMSMTMVVPAVVPSLFQICE